MNTNTDHATPELFAALSKAQGEIENATKNSKNPHFKSTYADLAEVLNTVRPVFAAHGLSLTQAPSFDGSLASVTTVIAHAGGGYIVATASCVPAKSDAQGIGSATTYLRRYGAAAAAGIAQEDDDGQSAAHDGKPKPKPNPDLHPAGDVWATLTPEQADKVNAADANMREYLDMDDLAGAIEYKARAGLDTDETVAFWTFFNSYERAALKKAHDGDLKGASEHLINNRKKASK
jgi:hypothetical protein